jgi:hypothetical protein
MHPIIKNILAVLVGLFVGGAVNMSIIEISGSIIPPPEGFDIRTEEGLRASMHLLEARHFIFPFLAHAIGTLVGAILTALIAANNKQKLALLIGLFFLVGGIWMVAIIPAPIVFVIVDLTLAYLPCAWLGARLVSKKG